MYAELNAKKRKREEAALEDESKSVDDFSLDEGKIPTEGMTGVAGVQYSKYLNVLAHAQP